MWYLTYQLRFLEEFSRTTRLEPILRVSIGWKTVIDEPDLRVYFSTSKAGQVMAWFITGPKQ